MNKIEKNRLADDRDKPRNLKLGLCICSWDFIYGLGITQCYQLNQFLSLRLLRPFFDNVLIEPGGLPHVFLLTWDTFLTLFGLCMANQTL